ncbi:MAG: response regulator [Treponemataceae bacterium]|nr:response regulator [Treponemataceae bacterium]
MAKDLNKTVVYSALEVANICGVVNQTAINWIRNGHLKAFSTPGGQYRVYRDDLVLFMKNRGMRIPQELSSNDAVEKSNDSILIVDDDQGLNAVLKKYLEKVFPDLVIHQAFDGFEAGAKMVEKHPFCVLLDLDLPGVNGFDLCAKLKQAEEFNKPYVIIITALEEPDLEKKVKDLGADLFFQKPLHLKEIADSMKSFFESLSEN